jgi:hypothetical protein
MGLFIHSLIDDKRRLVHKPGFRKWVILPIVKDVHGLQKE